ncbi:hypothetical protein [Streptomyces sp. STR69]|uniref:hypothetical protein n=1 Tax=Streptomyces sp. STR69 TaxID=1796942 RepID=UPI0021C6C726|nr:hypothetical protein [Streptomyces sp. STR69]
MSTVLPTPNTFVQAHGDLAVWCGAEFDEYLAACDRSKDITERLERAAAVAARGATSAEILEAFTGGTR